MSQPFVQKHGLRHAQGGKGREIAERFCLGAGIRKKHGGHLAGISPLTRTGGGDQPLARAAMGRIGLALSSAVGIEAVPVVQVGHCGQIIGRSLPAGEALEPMPMTPEQFGQYIRDDIARWSRFLI